MSDKPFDRNTRIKLWALVAETKRLCLECAASKEMNWKMDELNAMLKIESEVKDENSAMTAQVSLYPLRQASLSPGIEEALQIFRKHDVEVVPGAMSTVIAGSESPLWNALQSAFHAAAKQGETVMLITVSNACPWSFTHQDVSR